MTTILRRVSIGEHQQRFVKTTRQKRELRNGTHAYRISAMNVM
jgi:hypothetical protein